jgi:hypothetical protein
MRFLLAIALCALVHHSAFALSISAETDRGFRFFKFNSDFELQRLAYRDYREKHGGQRPTIMQLDTMLNDLNWWYRDLSTKTSAWYGHRNPVQPIVLLAQWRAREIAKEGRAAGYLELFNTLESKRLTGWEYHPVRMGWASLLFPAHQRPEDLGRGDLVSASKVAVCWHRAEQAHSNCGGLAAYLDPKIHGVLLRATTDADTRVLDGQCRWQLDAASGARFERQGEAASPSATLPCSELAVAFIPAGQQASVTLQTDAGSASATLAVADALVVGIGDSFSSGEGNPDAPAKLGWSADTSVDWAADGEEIIDAVTAGPVRKNVGDYYAAQWIDRACHRSAYSYQLRSALHLALERDDRAITFLGYACSGAEVNEGLFQPFQGPEYSSSKDGMPSFRKAQLSLLLSELCTQYIGSGVSAKPFSGAQEDRAIAQGRYKFGQLISDPAYRCAREPAGKGFKRKIDLLHAGIGGNDLGFAKWIMAAITSEGLLGAFFPVLKEDQDPECRGRARQKSCQETRARWSRLKARYALLRDFVDTRLSFSDRGRMPVLFFTYPVPVRAADGQLCPEGNNGLTVFTKKPDAIAPRVCLTRTQGNLPVLETIEAFTDSKLNDSIARLVGDRDDNGAQRPAWLAITGYRTAFAKRGFCASDAPAEPFTGCKSWPQVVDLVNARRLTPPQKQETLHLPSVTRLTGGEEWRPFQPVFDYRPYHHRSRLLRTMNESYFVINQLTSATQRVKASGLLSLATAAASGSFHPTAEAHAIFADDFFVESSRILAAPLVAN